MKSVKREWRANASEINDDVSFEHSRSRCSLNPTVTEASLVAKKKWVLSERFLPQIFCEIPVKLQNQSMSFLNINAVNRCVISDSVLKY